MSFCVGIFVTEYKYSSQTERKGWYTIVIHDSADLASFSCTSSDVQGDEVVFTRMGSPESGMFGELAERFLSQSSLRNRL